MKFVRLSLVLVAVLLIASLALYRNPRFARGQTQNGSRKVALLRRGASDRAARNRLPLLLFARRLQFHAAVGQRLP